MDQIHTTIGVYANGEFKMSVQYHINKKEINDKSIY